MYQAVELEAWLWGEVNREEVNTAGGDHQLGEGDNQRENALTSRSMMKPQ